MSKTSLIIVMLVALFTVGIKAQPRISPVPEPQFIAVDSKDNVYAAIKYGIVRITPDGTFTNLTKVAGTIGEFDKTWKNLIVDSRDNLYASDGNLIYKFSFDRTGKFVASVFAGNQGSNKLEDGPIATAGFNMINLMVIDRSDNIYVADSYDKIKAVIGSNFVTDSYFLVDPAKKYIKYKARNYSVIRKISSKGVVTTLKSLDGKFVLPNEMSGMAADESGNLVYSANGFARFIGKIDVSTGMITSIAGQPYKREWCPVYTQGITAQAEFVAPESILVNNKGEIVFADQRLHRLIRISGGKVATLAGGSVIDPCSQNIGGRAQEGFKDGPALTALFNFPKGMAYDSKGNLLIADMSNHAIRKLSPQGIVTTLVK